MQQKSQTMLRQLLLISLLGLRWTTGSEKLCTRMFPSQQPPSTADSVRPSDVAALSFIGLHEHSTELSTVLSKLTELMTMFNPELVRHPSDEKDAYSPKFLQHDTLVQQAKEVSLYLQSKKDIDANLDWNLVLLFVQVDKLCACKQVPSEIKRVVAEVDDALQLLHSELKRTIVSVTLWDGEYDTIQENRGKCPCVDTAEGELRLQRALATQALQESLDELLVERGWYHDRDDFTVTLQDKPFIRDPSSAASGTPDDVTVQMWKNLLQPSVDRREMEDNGNIVPPPCPTEDRPFLRTEGNFASYHRSEAAPLTKEVSGTEMPCEDLGPSDSIPSSVHELRPGDIKVVAAVGDSLTAGNGIAARPNNILDVLKQDRGLSWSIGGDENLTTITTLPNILKHFNPNVTGFSVDTGKQDTPQAFLNQAVAGAKSKDVPSQVKALVARMKNDSRIDFESDWKLITMFIGGNDACDHCDNTLHSSVENYTRYVQESLDYLQKEVPRALVNLVEVLHITPLREMHAETSLRCPTWLVNILCPCVIAPKPNSDALQILENINKGYQRGVQELVETGRYDTRSDFTVVVQPFFREIIVPRLPDGRPDRSFFSADCFHLSKKAQRLMARSLWNNMLEPLGKKTFKQTFDASVQLKCPTKASPFIFTKINSLGPSPPTDTTSTTTVMTSPATTSSISTSSSVVPQSPTSVPVWVPVIVGIVCLLAGILVTWFILSYLQQKKYKKGKDGVGMKGTGF
ncbi:unnamed protein product [Menidia menidia]|uniref:(Atlantic silverside) hypothetical protein n=1 Tax=Menidia menidia TaxID=238744 RepID=A0A8S4B8C7_9TELE|nr:unnamed protein product [Menidia menidia]